MKRRDFLRSSAALATLGAMTTDLSAQEQSASAPAGAAREFYELRRYHLRMGPKQRLVEDYLHHAAIPAWNRAGISTVGVFNVMVGPDSPTIYVLLPCPSFEALLAAHDKILADETWQKDGADYINAANTDPAFVRIESSFLRAFEGHPKLVVPEAKPRVFELRTYQSPTEKAGRSKIQMFNRAEIDIFHRTGLHPVFFGQGLVSSRLPHLTYMLVFSDLKERDKNWAAFGADSDWHHLSGLAEYRDNVSNITNIFLQPASFSQI